MSVWDGRTLPINNTAPKQGAKETTMSEETVIETVEAAPTFESLTAQLLALGAERQALIDAYEGVQEIKSDLADNEAQMREVHAALGAFSVPGFTRGPLEVDQPEVEWVADGASTKFSKTRLARLQFIEARGSVTCTDQAWIDLVNSTGRTSKSPEAAAKNAVSVLLNYASDGYLIKAGRGKEATYSVDMANERVIADYARGSEEG